MESNSISNMPSDARVWVYQSNRFFEGNEVAQIKELGNAFIAQWAAHGASLKASFDVLYNLFIVIAVDEKQAMASGCSIDSSVRFVKDLEIKFGFNLFDRMRVAYLLNDKVNTCSYQEFEQLAKTNIVNETTIVFNNMVSTKAQFDSEWRVLLKNSWQSRALVD